MLKFGLEVEKLRCVEVDSSGMVAPFRRMTIVKHESTLVCVLK
jgi:hypothetical protein